MSLSEKRSVERSGVVFRITRILESFTREAPVLPLRDIAAAAELPSSTTRRLLTQLEEAGLIAQNPQTQLYAPTAKLAHIGALSLNALSLEEVARPGLKRLSEKSGEAAFLGRLEGREAIYLAHETQARDVTISIKAGDAREALTTAIGSVIIAQTPSLYTPGAPNHIFTEDEYFSTLEDRFNTSVDQVRSQGYILGFGGQSGESTSLAVPVNITGAHMPVAIAVSGPSYRFTHQDALALLPDLLDNAKYISETYAQN